MPSGSSLKCQITLEKGITKEICSDFRKTRSYVMCRAWDLVSKEKIPFRDAIRAAWEEVTRACMK